MGLGITIILLAASFAPEVFAQRMRAVRSGDSTTFPKTVQSVLNREYVNRPFPQASETGTLKFVGRFFDVYGVQGCFADMPMGYYWPCMTGFDSKIVETPTRLLLPMTATLVGWNKSTLPTRLGSEPLSYFKGTPYKGAYRDAFLPWDAAFHHLNPANGLNVLFADSRYPIKGVDVDDRGYIYYAFSNGWSGGPVILRDDGTTLKGVTQIMGSSKYVPAAGEKYATYGKTASSGGIKIVAVEGADSSAPIIVKSGSNYYLLQGKIVIDVTDVSNPKLSRSGTAFVKIIQASNTVAVQEGYTIKIYDAADFVNGMAPKKTFTGTNGGQYRGLAVDKATGRFFSIYYDSNPQVSNTSSSSYNYTPPKAYIAVFSGSGANITETKYEISLGGKSGATLAAQAPFLPVDLQYASGYLAATGYDSKLGKPSGVANNIKVWNMASGKPAEVGGTFFKNYYGTPYEGDGSGIQSASVHVLGGKAYLFVITTKYGDVFELGAGTGGGGTTFLPGSGLCGAGHVYNFLTGMLCSLTGGGNAGPTITSVSGPTTLAANTQGTWTVTATDPNNDDIVWSVDWGSGRTTQTCKINPPAGTGKNSTYSISHAWLRGGAKTVKVYATDCRGSTAEKTFTVDVSGGPGGGGGGVRDENAF